MIAFISGYPDTAENDPDACVGEDVVEQCRVLAVPIAYHVCVFEVHGEVPGGLGDPGGGRVRGGVEDSDPAAGVFDDREYVQARAGQGAGLEEVAGQ
jgi:hypothetical protein